MDEGVNDRAGFDLFAESFQRSYLVVLRLPVETVFADGVVANGGSGHMTDEFLLFKLIERESITTFCLVVILLDIGNHTRSNHQLHITRRSDLISVLVLRLEVLSDDVPVGDDIGTEIVVHQSNQCGREKIWSHQSLETHTSRQHGDDLRVTRQFGCKEDNGDEYEQR